MVEVQHAAELLPAALHDAATAWRGSGIVADMEPEIPATDYCKIEELIASKDSPVGIDVKKTHIIVIHKLRQIEERLERLERLVSREGI